MQKIRHYLEHRRARLKSGEWKKDMLDLLFYMAEGYLLVVAVMVIFQRQVMYLPASGWSARPSAGTEIVTYKTADGISLTSWYAPPQKGKPVFVMFHGNAGNISGRNFIQDFFASRGYGFMLAEYRGYGGNEGKPSEDGLYSDGRAALTWLMQEKKIALEDAIIFGESIGTGVASEMALEFKNAKALILEAPLTNAPEVAKSAYPWLAPFSFMTLDRYDNLSKAPYFNMPVLIINGSNDKVIPPEQGKRLFAAVGTPHKKLVVLEGGGHNDLAEFGLLAEMLKFTEEL